MIAVTRRRKLLLSALVGASLGQAMLAAVAAFCVQRVFDALLAHNGQAPAQEAVLIAVVFASSALLAAAIETYRAWAGERLGLGYVAEVREELFDKIMHASPATLGEKRQGGLLLPFVGDLTAIKKWVSDGLVRLISAGATTLLLLGVLGFEAPRLALAAGCVVAGAAIALVWLSAPLSLAIRQTRARRGAVANFVSSSIRSAQTIQAFSRFPREAQRLRRRNDALTKAGLRLATVSGVMTAIVHLAAALLVAAALIVGVIEVRRGAMSIGTVAAAISIVGLLAGAIRDLGIAFELWRRAKVSFARVAAALSLEPAVKDIGAQRRLPARASNLSLESVAVEGLFEGVTLEAMAGDVVNVIGESGAGKSTLLALAARMRDPDRGRVRINGRNLRRTALASVRRQVGIASASVPLLRGSIAMNLRYRSPSASAAEIARVVEICNLKPVFDRFPAREQTRLGDNTRELSLGETQRLLIARAMVDNPPLLILDDVDSRLDGETAARIAQALRSYNGTVLMAATAPALRGVATLIWRIDGGGVSVEAAQGRVIDIVHSAGAAVDKTASP